MSKPQPHAGPSRPFKVINKTTDLVRRNGSDKSKGKGKEKEVLGNVVNLVDEVKRLPGLVHVEEFAEARALEIHAFQTAIKAAAAQGSSRAFQSLPRHLRRRAASHNPRRVPKRLRSKAAAEIDAGDRIAQAHRKRAKQVAKGTLRDKLSRTEQFALRQRNKIWLPTHLWHAKRYHMTNLWGYRLPITPTMKSFRPAYRAGRRKAIAWDTSYFGILEIEGNRKDVLDTLQRMIGDPFAGEKYESGARSAQISIYHYDSFPRHLIGPAEIIWQPPNPNSSESSRRLWLRLHPSIFNETWNALKVAVAASRTASSSSSQNSGLLQIRDLRGDVDSLEIMGPKAGKALRRALRVCRSESGTKRAFYDNLARIDDPAEILEGTILGLKVHDPRLHFPPSRLSDSEIAGSSSANEGETLQANNIDPSADLAKSRLWDEDVRESLTKAKYTKYQLDARRHKLGLPGTKLEPMAKDDRIPLVLIRKSVQSPLTLSEGEGFHGFTILLPRGWIMYLLSSLVYASTLIGGLEERRVQYREAGVPCFPEHYGDTCRAGTQWELDKGRKEQERWERKPPGKRPEYGVLGTKSPFAPDWAGFMGGKDLSAEEMATNGHSTVKPWLLRKPFTDHISGSTTSTKLLLILNAFRRQRGMNPISDVKAKPDELFVTALVHVEVQVLSRGSPGDMAMIHSLDKQERSDWIDALESVGLTRAGQVDEMHELGEIPTKESEIIGYTSTGNFSLSRGMGHALGTITLKGYISLLHAATAASERGGKDKWDGRCLVKVRNRDGRLARLAEIKVVS